ncbi:alpha/beta hydrolase [Kribbella sp. NPDC056861]|uniref:alpha/beta hydrolase n=1 Tax=Kribbella sp. NPDC056861 TaxID=3154857 RepID=UPI003414E11A
MKTRWKQGLSVAVIAAGISGLLVPGVATAKPAGISWSECKPGSVEQCGKLSVPLDWAKPAGAKTEIYVARVPAKDQAHKLGSLTFNPGGPGGAGASIFADGLADRLFPDYRDRYDLVSFDPRGSGSSTALACGPVLRPGVPVFPKNKAQYDAMVASSRATGEACLKKHGDFLRNLDTRTAARDMDAIRAALGEEKLNFIGLSYGSYLGTTYAQLFPQRVGRMVLDGILDHAQGATRLMLDEARTMEDTFNRFAAWCDKDASCALHGQDVGKVWDKLVAKADKTPLPVPDHPPVTGDTLRMTLPALMPKTDFIGNPWPPLAEGIAQAVEGDASLFAETSYLGDYETAYAAVSCMDLPGELKGYADAKARLALAKAVAPRVGAAVEGWVITAACAGWPIKPSNPWQPTPVNGVPPILLTSTKHDPSTPVSNAYGLARQIQGSRLVVADDAIGHTAYLNSACGRAAIAAYLIDGKLPPKRSTCR